MWEYIPFENCLEKTKIKFKLPKKDYKESGEYPIVSQEQSLISGYHDDISYIFKVAKPIVVFGDHTLALKYIDFDFIVGADGVKILQPVEEINTKYFYYVLKALIPKTTGYARHYKLLKKLDIPVPPLPEQERIVAKLDAAFAEIDGAFEAADAAAMNLSSLRSILYEQIIIQNCSTFTEYTLKEIVSENCSLSYGIVQPGEDVPNGLPIVRPVDMHKKFINTKLLKRINPLIADGYKRTILEGNELLMSVRGTTGIISVTSDVLEGANVTRGIIPIRFNSQLVERDFGYYAMLSHKVQKQISDATYGAALQQINVKDVKQIKIAIPAISEQKNIIDILSKIDKNLLLLERCSSQKTANINSLKSAILAQELQSSEAA
jgi:type I restriction enzyme, S subunit